MITLGADLYPISQYSYTPLIHVCIGFIVHWDLPPSEFPIDIGLHLWLKSLESCGVDLYEYGKQEEKLHEKGLVRHEIKIFDETHGEIMVKLASFTYGSSPGDWDIKLYWKYLDRYQDSGQVEEMPGGWIEE